MTKLRRDRPGAEPVQIVLTRNQLVVVHRQHPYRPSVDEQQCPLPRSRPLRWPPLACTSPRSTGSLLREDYQPAPLIAIMDEIPCPEVVLVPRHMTHDAMPAAPARDPLDNTLSPDGQMVYRHDPDKARAVMRQFKAVFGDRYYAEVMPIDFARYMAAVPAIIGMAQEEGVPIVTTCDAHYELIEDAAVQWVMSRINSGARVDEIGDIRQKQGCYFIRDATQMQHPLIANDMIERTCEVAARCNVDLSAHGYLFPPYPLEQDVDWREFHAWRHSEAFAGVA